MLQLLDSLLSPNYLLLEIIGVCIKLSNYYFGYR
ncbi:hypothetical protein F383_29418 [Gossypium arboreum]|uniref:Uncharacterized protein n=1 Tax=Gossypium arboreum TaxID=29729 RepID=A0A0B0PHD5_GOSAR|nr:hypothetical protein F383_29418 [Gossypium arboreum]